MLVVNPGCPVGIAPGSDGNVWFTDHGCGTPEGRKFGALLHATCDGKKITRARDHLISPNGVGLSPDESVVYMADTQLGRLYDIALVRRGRQQDHGRLECPRVVAQRLEHFDAVHLRHGQVEKD